MSQLQCQDSLNASVGSGEPQSRSYSCWAFFLPLTSRDSATAFPADIGFRSRERLVEHYRHHGREFGAISMEEYLARAQALRDRPAGGPVLETRRPDGVITRFDRGSGAFLAFDSDGTIRTFFRPTQGERYFHRQIERTSP